jgi:hypothetical protein
MYLIIGKTYAALLANGMVLRFKFDGCDENGTVFIEVPPEERPAEDRRYNRAFARRRIGVEHAIGRLRRYQALTAVNHHGRRGHAARVRAVAGLVNRMLKQKAA